MPKIYNAEGIEVSTITSGEMEVGLHSVSFNTNFLPQGIYFLRMNAGGKSIAKKMTVVK